MEKLKEKTLVIQEVRSRVETRSSPAAQAQPNPPLKVGNRSWRPSEGFVLVDSSLLYLHAVNQVNRFQENFEEDSQNQADFASHGEELSASHE
ncbi:hypothetical protein QQP08_027515 [Theobroma cacao]|nr:hypothetical protein QQP08_027515 [Theobroma cacao]